MNGASPIFPIHLFNIVAARKNPSRILVECASSFAVDASGERIALDSGDCAR
jgi:hypothetical protein